MKPRCSIRTRSAEGGFILALVLVFLVVLSLSAFVAAALTRTDVQVVNNLQNEKEAFAIAEAGVHEALYRMSLAMGDKATVSGVNGGTAFNASLAPVVPGRAAPTGVTAYGIDSTNTTKVAQIVLTGSGPQTGTNRNWVPSLQPTSSRLLYSTTAADSDSSAVSLASTANVTIGWDICQNATDPGCSAVGAIRQLPLSHPRYVAEIVSTGQSGSARRRIVAKAVDCVPGSGLGSVVTLGQGCGYPNGGISMNGSTSITAYGSIDVNAGATTNPPSGCSAATTGGAGSSINSTTGTIEIVGSTGGNGTFSPEARTGVSPTADPLSSMLPPCFTNYSPTGGCNTVSPTPTAQNHSTNASLPTTCTGIDTAPTSCTVVGTVTLQPGIYYGGLSLSGNVTLTPGVYIIAGGGINMATGSTAITSTGTGSPGGVMIYNTQDPSLTTGQGAYGAISWGTGNATASITAPSSGDYKGIALFQDRLNTTALDLTGGNSGNYSLNGTVYAPNAPASLQGHTNGTLDASFVVQALNLTGGSNISVGSPASQPTTCDNTQYVVIGWQDF